MFSNVIAGAGELMRRRSGIVEHPFGTLKCRAGYRHFLVRGFNKVRGEWSLMVLCYNFTACSISSVLSASSPAWQRPLPCENTLSQPP
jgi:Transposase DDE domain